MARVNKRKLLRRAALAAACAAVALLLLAGLAKWWIVPAVVRQRLAGALGEYWDGTAAVESIDFRFFGPTRLTGLAIKDRQGRAWLTVGSARFHLDGWPGFSPVLTDVRVESVRLRAHFADGRCEPPLRPWPKKRREPSKYVDLRELAVRGIRLELACPQASLDLLGELDLGLSRKGDRYELSLGEPGFSSAGPGAEPNACLLARGWVPARSGELDVSARLSRPIGGEELRCLQTILGVRAELSGTAVLAGTFAAQGQIGGELTIQPAGRIELTVPRLSTGTGELVEDLVAWADLGGEGRKLVAVGRIDRGTVSQGPVGGTFTATLVLAETGLDLSYDGQLGVKGLSLPQLERALRGRTRMRSGTLGGMVSFQGRRADLGALRYQGRMLLKDAEAEGDSVAARLAVAIFERLRIDPKLIEGGSDVYAAFRGEGTVIRLVEEARVENNLSALVAEPGGTIDWGAETADVYVIGAPVKDLRNVLASLPILGALTGLTDKLTRLRVTGPWESPTIAKEPAKDIQEGTVAFFRGVVGGGGLIGEALLKPLNGLLRGRNGDGGG